MLVHSLPRRALQQKLYRQDYHLKRVLVQFHSAIHEGFVYHEWVGEP